MKVVDLIPCTKINIVFIAFSALLLLSLTSCGRKLSFLPSTIVPGAEGSVAIKSDENKNHRIKLNIYNLAEPDKLENPGKMYIVWMQNDQNATTNLGQIRTSSGTFTRNLRASFETVSPFKPVKIFITAEQDANVQLPNRKVILTTDRL